MRMLLLGLAGLVGCSEPSPCRGEPRIYTLSNLPVTDWTLGLPVTGDGKLVVALFPREVTDWTRATGFVEFTCDDCTLGDDKTQMQVDFWGEKGIDFGHITFDTARARADFADGRMHLVVRWRSRDMTLDADVAGALAPAADDIALDGCIVFAPTEALRKRAPKTHAVVATTGAPIREDGKFTIRIEGTFGTMRRLAKLCEVPTVR